MKKLILLLPLLGGCQLTSSEAQLANVVAIGECQRIKNQTQQLICMSAVGIAIDRITLPTKKP